MANALGGADLRLRRTPPVMPQNSAAQDAQFSVSGISHTSSSNTVSDALSGVTLTLLGTTACRHRSRQQRHAHRGQRQRGDPDQYQRFRDRLQHACPGRCRSSAVSIRPPVRPGRCSATRCCPASATSPRDAIQHCQYRLIHLQLARQCRHHDQQRRHAQPQQRQARCSTVDGAQRRERPVQRSRAASPPI